MNERTRDDIRADVHDLMAQYVTDTCQPGGQSPDSAADIVERILDACGVTDDEVPAPLGALTSDQERVAVAIERAKSIFPAAIPSLIREVAERILAGQSLGLSVGGAGHRRDDEPCPVCGGDRLRSDFTDSGQCHVKATRPMGARP